MSDGTPCNVIFSILSVEKEVDDCISKCNDFQKDMTLCEIDPNVICEIANRLDVLKKGKRMFSIVKRIIDEKFTKEELRAYLELIKTAWEKTC